jgi:uncharacterized protein YndB with AHSA1/START domain
MSREFEIRKDVPLDATPEQVWDAIATGPGLASWFMPVELEPGGQEVAAWDPPKRLAVRLPPAPDGSVQAFEYLIEARDGGSTVLRFVHSGILGDDWSDEFEGMTRFGWDMYLHTLGAYLRHFPGRYAAYVFAEGPASSAEPAAWTRLLEHLAVPATVATGDRVRVDAPGEGIDGVVDYVGPTFLGIRTADALYRFHGRSPLGMTIAVGHHIYAGGIDVEAANHAWRDWLAAALG